MSPIMTFVVESLTRCAGQNHYRVTGTVNGEPATVDFLAADLSLDPGEVRDAVFLRLRSAVKEAGAATFAQAKAAIEGRTFQV